MRSSILPLVLLACLFFATLPAAAAETAALPLAGPFQRIVSLWPAHTANLVELGLDREILAVSADDPLPGKRPRIACDDDPARVVALKPDLVLIRPQISRDCPALVRALEQRNIRVLSLQPAKASQLFAYWEALGKLTGREREARTMIETFSRKLATITADVRQIPKEKRKRVYFEAAHRPLHTFAPASLAMFVLESAGGVNVAADAERLRETPLAAYGRERLLAKADQIDLYLAQSGRTNPVSVDDILREPGFKAIPAVRKRQIFLVDEELIAQPTMALIQTIGFVKSLLYPDYDQNGITGL
ncbi:MAG: ABC transporter substrate-binding protein [Desulfobulbus sp.]|nr:ABC transporter substrate-binding protein [Desulfobulbus sp.]